MSRVVSIVSARRMSVAHQRLFRRIPSARLLGHQPKKTSCCWGTSKKKTSLLIYRLLCK